MVAMHIFARSCILLERYDLAAELLEQVVRMEDAVRHAMNESALLMSMFDVQASVYEDLQWVQVELGRYTDALVSAERGHARVLARQIAEREEENESPPDFDEIRKLPPS